jgi:ribonuclease T1
VFSTGSADRAGSTRSAPGPALGKWGLANVANVTHALAVVALASGLLTATDSQARKDPETPASLPTVALAALPVQAQHTYKLVLNGGPFPYRKDGTVFGNRERLLPGKARGYYREYTVPTPGSADRGARRIVCGGPQPTVPDACFYTADHYASFRLIAR